MDEQRNRSANAQRAAAESKDIEVFRQELLASLPGLIDKAVRSYGRFAADRPPDDPKGFLAYQAGCRAAVTHIHLLVKLADWAQSSGAEEALSSGAEQLDRMVREAEVALRDAAIDDDD
jgi:hypothetical protein